jgi:hypothetical protein
MIKAMFYHSGQTINAQDKTPHLGSSHPPLEPFNILLLKEVVVCGNQLGF